MSNNINTLTAIASIILSTSVYAETDFNTDASLIREIAEKHKVSVAEVEKSIAEGCNSPTTRLMNECANYRYSGADIQLNRVYLLLMKKLKSKNAEPYVVDMLRDMQKTWIAHRDATCKYESEAWGSGTGYHAVYTACLQAETEKRTIKLNEYLICENSCPGY